MKKISVNQVDRLLQNYLGSRADLGVWKAVQTTILQPANPFDPASVRRPQRCFVLLLLFTTALIAVFVYFNFLS